MKQHKKIKNHVKINYNIINVNTKIILVLPNSLFFFDVSGFKNSNIIQKQDYFNCGIFGLRFVKV